MAIPRFLGAKVVEIDPIYSSLFEVEFINNLELKEYVIKIDVNTNDLIIRFNSNIESYKDDLGYKKTRCIPFDCLKINREYDINVNMHDKSGVIFKKTTYNTILVDIAYSLDYSETELMIVTCIFRILHETN